MRKLATVRIIKEVYPIEGADNIEVVSIDGWKCVSKKGEFKAGDKCIYFEIDSYLPIKPHFEFLRKSCYKSFTNGIEGFRLKTIKLRGQISQGLALPLSCLNISSKVEVGKDLTDKLGIIKYEPELIGQMHKHKSWIRRRLEQLINILVRPFRKEKISQTKFPTHLCPKTDEERVQNIDIKDILGKTYEITEKCDGSSMTVIYHDSNIMVCSRNLIVTDEDTNFIKAFNNYNLKEKLSSYKKNIALQGELIGASIQGNKYKLNELRYLVFKIYDIDNKRFFSSYERQQICKDLELEHVPILDIKKLEDIDVDKILSMAEGESKLFKTEREGIVFKDIESGFSFKAISNKFLIKNNE